MCPKRPLFRHWVLGKHYDSHGVIPSEPTLLFIKNCIFLFHISCILNSDHSVFHLMSLTYAALTESFFYLPTVSYQLVGIHSST